MPRLLHVMCVIKRCYTNEINYGCGLSVFRYAAGRAGGTMTGVFSAANEEAVAQFLDKKIGYFDIFKVVEATCAKHMDDLILDPSLEDIYHIDKWARQYVRDNCITKTMSIAMS